MLLIQSVIALLLVSCSMNRRKQFYLRLITSVLAGCAVQYLVRGIYIAGSTPPAMLSHAAAALLVYITLSAITWFCYDESIWTVLLMTATGYIVQDIAGSVKTLFRQIEWVNSFSRQQGGILIVDLVCYGAVYVLMFFALRPFVRNRNDNFDNKRKAVFALQYGVMEQARLAKNMETMRELVHTQRVQYEASKESAQLINEKYHDLKHLLKSFRGTVPQEQLDQLKHSIAAYERPANSGNEVLDVLLAEKIGICQQRNIVLTCSVGMTDFSFVEELDLYSLFQNALTNAINAVSALPEGSERFISLSSARDGNMLTIHMENPCEEEITFVNGLPQTKGDPDWHGFGMKSMNRIAEKYNGMLTAEQRGKMFFMDILLLAPER